MVFNRVRNLRKKWNKSKIGSKINQITGNRYGRGAKQILTKGVPQLTKDVLMMKKMLNAEKKRIGVATSNTSFGQLNYNSSAYIATDITPIPAQGVTSATRNGASIKLNSAFLKFQVYHQSSTTQPIKFRIIIAKVAGIPESNMNTFFQQCWQPNTFLSSTIYDFHSQPNPDYFRAYKIIKSRTVTVPADQITGVNMIKDISIPLKFKNHHIRFNADTTTVSSGQLVMWVVADCGNISSGSASTVTPIAVSGTSTGLIMNTNFMWYYYDN